MGTAVTRIVKRILPQDIVAVMIITTMIGLRVANSCGIFMVGRELVDACHEPIFHWLLHEESLWAPFFGSFSVNGCILTCIVRE